MKNNRLSGSRRFNPIPHAWWGATMFLIAYSALTVPENAVGASGPPASSAPAANAIRDKVYGRRYSRAILRGVTLDDVFQFNTARTTPFGPAYANVWLTQANFLACAPPTGRAFSYALCYYSGPDEPTGTTPDNPSLPCTLSPDGTVANCSCYEISTNAVSAKIPYFVDIHAVSNRYLYDDTVDTCGKQGERCAATDRDPNVCDAINAGTLVPDADMISVFSPIYASNYISRRDVLEKDTSTDCDTSLYAGCMTAPCYRTDRTDTNGNNIVECKCPVFEGPYQIGQPKQNCDANESVAATTAGPRQDISGLRDRNVWSAAYNPNGGPIDPLPDGACVPDVPGAKSTCGLFDPTKDYAAILDPRGALCTNVCSAYASALQADGAAQVGYTCDATLCTTLGIGQDNNDNFPPAAMDRAALLGAACNGIDAMNGIDSVMLVETLAECSCCASQVCECDGMSAATQGEVGALNQQQRNVGIWPQCDINQTLCGATPPQ